MALRLAAYYAIAAIAWIVFSDQLISAIPELSAISWIRTGKGIAFVGVTALILYAFLRKLFAAARHDAEEREAALNASVHRYQILFDASPTPMWVYDVETLRFLDVNDSALSLYGYDREEMLTLTILDIRPEQERAGMRELVDSLPPGLNDGGIRTHRKKDGAQFRVQITTHGLILDGRKARLVQARDVTEEERMEDALRESEQRWAFAIESTNDGVWDWNILTGEVYYSDRDHQMLGYQPGEFKNNISEWTDRLHPDDAERVWDELKRHFRHETRLFRIEYRLRTKSGAYMWVLARGKVIHWNEGGQPQRMIGTISDINANKIVESSLRLAAAVFEQSHEGQFVLDESLRIISANRAFSGITGYGGSEARGETLDLLGRNDPDWLAVQEIALRDLGDLGHWEGEGYGRRKNGEPYPLWLSLSSIRNQLGEVTHYCGLLADTSERKEAAERIQFLSNYDPLTQLPNRLLFNDRLKQLIAHAERRHERLAVCLLDIDHFRTINESMGHAAGDRLLQKVTRLLQETLRSEDTLSRQGGDEFVLAMPGMNDANDAARAAEKLLMQLREGVHVNGRDVSCSLSIGISLYPDDGGDVETLVRNADAALSHAKQSGRNSFRFYAPQMNARASELLALESGMRGALERDEFELHFQPQVSAENGRLVGAEALVRWRHPERGLIPPGLFIPLAEERGFIVELGEWILNEACRQSMKWREQGLPPIPVAINLSAMQFRDLQLGEKIAYALRNSGLPASDLELEITESVLMDVEAASETLGQLREMGVKLSIDDFGTGFSSLAYLRRFPIDKLKIDQSFIRDLRSGEDNNAIVRTIIQLAKNLDLSVIAEGVETETEWLILKALDCDEIQGYYFSRPLPAYAFIDWAKNNVSAHSNSAR